MSVVQVTGLGFAVGGTAILRDVSLIVPAGSRCAIVGASGSGKSTLLRLIAGFVQPTQGTVAVGGTIVAGGGRSVPAHRRRVAYVPQDGALFPHLTARANIGFGLRHADRAAVERAAELVGLERSLLDRRPHELSGGQQQRVALARAIAVDPPVIVMDEPFSALDAGLRAGTRAAVVAALAAAGTTAVLVTHDQDEALTFGDGLGVLQDGVLTQRGSPAEVFDAPATRSIAAFLGAAVFLRGVVRGSVAETVLGRIPLRAPAAEGSSVEVLLRPAQLHAGADGVPGVVRDAARHGDVALLTVDVAGARIPLRVPALGPLPAPGDLLRIRVDGTGYAYTA